jgi:hypothetical protein
MADKYRNIKYIKVNFKMEEGKGKVYDILQKVYNKECLIIIYKME